MFNISCEVRGGVTGDRIGLLKSNGLIVFYEDEEAADKEAARLNAEMNGPNARASFSYTAIPSLSA